MDTLQVQTGGRSVSMRADVVHPAVVRLAEGTAVLRRIIADRPILVAEALLGGAVGRWATRIRQAGQLTERGYEDLLNIVFGPAG